MEFLLKAMISGVIVAAGCIAAQKSATVGALILGIPMVSLLTLVFMQLGGADAETFRKFGVETVYFVTISLVFFAVFGFAIAQWNFWLSLLLASAAGSIVMYFAFKAVS